MYRIRMLFALLFSFSILSTTFLIAQDNNKLPITTKSDKARQEFIKGRDILEKLRFQESIDYFSRAISEDPDFALAYIYRFQAQPSGKDQNADLNKAVSLAGKVSEGERLLIQSFEAGVSGNTEKQKDLAEKLVSLFPNDERVQTLAAGYYAGINDHTKDIEHLNKAIEINPNYSPAYNSLGYAYKNSGKLNEAETTFKKYIEVLPGDPNPHDSYAELLLKEGKFEEAITNYKKALNLNPEFNSSKAGIAAAYMYQGKYSEARDQINDLFQSAKNNPQRENALRLMAVTYADEGKLDEALTQLDKEYKIAGSYLDYPDMANINFRKGTVLYEMGKYDDAKKEYQSALNNFDKADLPQDAKDNFKSTVAYNNELISVMQHSSTLAAARTNEEIKNNVLKQQADRVKIITAIDKKDGDGALNDLKGVNQNDPYNIYLMGKANMIKGDNQQARDYFNKVITLNDLPTLNSALARYHARQELKNIK